MKFYSRVNRSLTFFCEGVIRTRECFSTIFKNTLLLSNQYTGGKRRKQGGYIMRNFAIVTLVLLVLMASSASAALELGSAPSLFGSSSQQRGQMLSAQFTLKNTGNASVTGLQLSNTLATKFNVSFTGLPAVLNVSQIVTITMNVLVPLDHSAVDANLAAIAIPIGTFTASGTDSATNATVSVASGQINMQAENRLSIAKAKVLVNGISTKTVSDGDRISKLKPGDVLDISVEARNDFSRNTNIDFRNARVHVFSDSRRDLDIEEDDTISLRSDDKETVEFSNQKVEDDARQSSTTMTIDISGTDTNGAKQGQRISVRMEVDRLSHEIRIDSATTSPATTVGCDLSSRNVRVDTRFTNVGRNDERNALIEVDAPTLGFNDKKSFVLNEDDSRAATFTLTVPKTATPGTHTINVNSYFDATAKSNSVSRNMIVPECTAPVTNASVPAPVTPVVTQQQPPVVQTPPAVTPAPTQQATVTPQVAPKARVTESFTDSPAYLVLLGAGIAVIVLLLVFVVVKVAMRKPEE